ncbi:MAG: AtpZ/AtpI family protein [Thermoguttaceae bacterium]
MTHSDKSEQHIDRKNHAPEKIDDRELSPIAIGYIWATRITGIGLEMVLPALFGIWLDQKFGTLILFMLIGLLVGFYAGLMQLIRLSKQH